MNSLLLKILGKWWEKNQKLRKFFIYIIGIWKVLWLMLWMFDKAIKKINMNYRHQVKKMVETIDNSDTQLIFNDIFVVRVENKKYLDFDVSEYGLFYNLCFQGFDDCLSDEEEVEEDEDNSSLNGLLVNDEKSFDSDYGSEYELDEDCNEYWKFDLKLK